jgi:Amt family ammonium transporter
VRLKFKAGFDDALDVVGVHLIGGLVGGLLIGVFASPSALGGSFEGGLIEGDGIGLLAEQIFANLVVGVYSFAITYVIARALKGTMGVRAIADDELLGLDLSYHAEQAYSQ